MSRRKPGLVRLAAALIAVLCACPSAEANTKLHAAAKAGKGVNKAKAKMCQIFTWQDAADSLAAVDTGVKSTKTCKARAWASVQFYGTNSTCCPFIQGKGSGWADAGCTQKSHPGYGWHPLCPDADSLINPLAVQAFEITTPQTPGAAYHTSYTTSAAGTDLSVDFEPGSFLKVDTRGAVRGLSSWTNLIVTVSDANDVATLASGEVKLSLLEDAQTPSLSKTGVFGSAALSIVAGPTSGTFVVDLQSADFTLLGISPEDVTLNVDAEIQQPEDADESVPTLGAWALGALALMLLAAGSVLMTRKRRGPAQG